MVVAYWYWYWYQYWYWWYWLATWWPSNTQSGDRNMMIWETTALGILLRKCFTNLYNVAIRYNVIYRKHGNVWPPCYDWYNDQFFLGWDNLYENEKNWKCKNVELCDHGHGYWRGLIQFQKRPAPDNDIDTDRNVGMMMIRAMMMMVKMLMMMSTKMMMMIRTTKTPVIDDGIYRNSYRVLGQHLSWSQIKYFSFLVFIVTILKLKIMTIPTSWGGMSMTDVRRSTFE